MRRARIYFPSPSTHWHQVGTITSALSRFGAFGRNSGRNDHFILFWHTFALILPLSVRARCFLPSALRYLIGVVHTNSSLTPYCCGLGEIHLHFSWFYHCLVCWWVPVVIWHWFATPCGANQCQSSNCQWHHAPRPQFPSTVGAGGGALCSCTSCLILGEPFLLFAHSTTDSAAGGSVHFFEIFVLSEKLKPCAIATRAVAVNRIVQPLVHTNKHHFYQLKAVSRCAPRDRSIGTCNYS